jgi:hypothetical protein
MWLSWMGKKNNAVASKQKIHASHLKKNVAPY